MAKNIERARYVLKQREERAWTQEQLALIANVHPRTIQRLEKDGAASPETQMAVAQAFKIDVKKLNAASRSRDDAPIQSRVHLLPRLGLGRDLACVAVGADEFQFDHDDDNDPRSVNAMKDLIGELKRDVVRLYDADPTERLSIEGELSQELSGLESCGYFLFGMRRVFPRIVSGHITLVSMATFYLSHSRSPKIVRDKAIMVIPALLPDGAH